MMIESTLPQKSVQERHLYFIIYLLMLGAFVIFFRLGDRDMWNGLESESAIAGWDMLETGRILIPHILDQPFIDNRPPGAWWLIAATYKLTGVRNTWTVRLPSALAALVCILLVYAMGRRAANGRIGTLDKHAALLFHLGRPVVYLQVANANNFLENANHYLIFHRQSDLEQIDEKFRRTIVLEYPYRHRRTAYLLQGRQ